MLLFENADDLIKGPISFKNLRTIDGVECQTYKACKKLNVLENYQRKEFTFMDASAIIRTSNIIRYCLDFMFSIQL